jgi:dinuclear metal center YbgI/SA1388 family protein
MPSVADIIEFMQDFAPLDLAEEWDNVGLLVGDANGPAASIMTCLTITPDSAAEAIEAGAGLIVSHHPVLFRASKRLTTGTSEGRMLLSLIHAGVAVYSPHTAFDSTHGGINDMIAGWLGLQDVQPLRPRRILGSSNAAVSYKVVAFVPDQDLHKVADAMFAAGAGQIGQYSQCSFRIPGTGTFFGSDSSNPTLGQKGRREEVSELRLEVVCTGKVLGAVVAGLRKAHSYEEPAFDIYPLNRDPSRTLVENKRGQGRIGRLDKPMPLAELARLVQKTLAAKQVQMVGEPARPIQRVAIACGAGGDFVADAGRAKADVLLTGEARFHDCLAAESLGLAMLLPGHYASERPALEALAGLIQRRFPDAKVWASQREHEPLQVIE